MQDTNCPTERDSLKANHITADEMAVYVTHSAECVQASLPKLVLATVDNACDYTRCADTSQRRLSTPLC